MLPLATTTTPAALARTRYPFSPMIAVLKTQLTQQLQTRIRNWVCVAFMNYAPVAVCTNIV